MFLKNEKWKSFRVGTAFLAVSILVFGFGLGQQAGAGLRGTVTDATGAVLPGVMVTATNQDTGVVEEAITNDRGVYNFPLLAPGSYSVSAELDGFRRSTVTDFLLETATVKRISFQLEVGDIQQEIRVVAEAVQQIQLETSDLSDSFFEEKIQQLPLSGRVPLELVFLQPGMGGHPSQGNAGGLSANGAKTGFNTIYMDGMDITSSELGTGANAGIAIATEVAPSVDAIEEFRVITGSPSAEFGRGSGFQVAVTTKSGTNEFHGSVYNFHRNTVLNANSFFNNASGTEREFLLRNNFGGSIGGPVWFPGYSGKNKTFFFFNYEAARQKETQAVTRTVLTQEARQGIYRFITPGVTINPDTGQTLTQNNRVIVDPVTGALRPGVAGIQSINLIDADLQYLDGIGRDATGLVDNLIGLTPMPNDFSVITGAGDGLNTAGFRFLAPALINDDRFTVKIDHILTTNHTLTARANWGTVDRTRGDFVNGVFQTFPGIPEGSSRDRLEDQLSGVFTLISSFSSSLTNEFRIGVSRNTREFTSTLETPNTLAITPGTFTNPFRLDEPIRFSRQTTSVSDNLTWTQGNHAIKMGFTVQFTLLNDRDGDSGIFLDFSSTTGGNGGSGVNLAQLFGDPNGSIPIPNNNQGAAADLFNLLTGRFGGVVQDFNAVSETEFGPPGTGKTRGFRGRDWGFFFQDDWKVSNNLTLNLGLRYDYFQVPWEVNSFFVFPSNRTIISSQLDPSMPPDQLLFGRVGPKFGNQIFDDDYNNLSPVFGFTWDPFGRSKTAIRGSYRVSYDHLLTSTLETLEDRAPGLETEGQTSGDLLFTALNLTNASGNRRAPRLADLAATATNTGITIGNGNISLSQILDVRGNQKPFAPIPFERLSLNPSEFEPNLVNPYSQSWSLGIQHEVLENTVVEARYVGRKGTKEFISLPANQFRVPSGWLPALQTVESLLNTTRGDAYAMAGLPLPDGVNPSSNVTISDLYGSAPSNASNFSQYSPGPLSSLAPPQLFNLFLATTSSFDSVFLNELRQVDLVGLIAAFDTSSGSRVHRTSFLESAGLNPLSGTRGALPLIIGLPINAFRPNPQFLNGPRLVSNAGFSNYNALQLIVKRRFSDGLQFDASYTFARNEDLTNTSFATGTNALNFFELNAEKSLSSNDLRHDFKGNFIYQLPFGRGRRLGSSISGWMNQLVGGWNLSGIVTIAGDFPFNVFFNSQRSSFQDGSRPRVTPGASLRDVIKVGKIRRDASGNVFYWTRDEFGNTFSQPALGVIGDSPRNFLRGPGFYNLDLNLSKDFAIREGMQVEFRAEFFNVVNNVNFSNPNGGLFSGTFGRITGQNGNPRIVQFALKLVF